LTHTTWGKGPLTLFSYKVEETEVSLGMVKLKNKGKVHPLTGHAGPEGEYKYCTTLSSSSVLDVGGWLMPYPRHFNSRKEMSYPLYRGWVGPRACLNGHEKSLALVGIQILDHPAHSQSLCWLH